MLNIFSNNALAELPYHLASILIMLLFTPYFIGLIRKFSAFFENRQGPSLFQPYRDLLKLLKKEVIIPEHSSWVFKFSPYLTLSSSIVMLAIIPSLNSFSPISGYSDMIFVFGLFALASFFMMLASLDTGTAFGGLGASREALVSALVEPIILLSILGLSLIFNSTNLFTIVADNSNNWEFVSHPSTFFIAIAFLILLTAETKRFPFDNPSTHLELTMIHEAMLLEYSGKYLAFMEYASMLKLSIYSTLFFSLFFSNGIAHHPNIYEFSNSILIWFAKMVVFAFCLALFEKSSAKLRLFRIPEGLSFALVLTLIAVFAHYYIQS